MRAILILMLGLFGLLAPGPARALEAGPNGYAGVPWGTVPEQIPDRLLAAGRLDWNNLVPLTPAWDFGPMEAPFLMRRQRLFQDIAATDADTVVEAQFTAYFQMDRDTGRLAQVVLEKRRGGAGPLAFQDLLAALTGRWGAADGFCTEPHPDGRRGAAVLRGRWGFENTTVHVSFSDFSSQILVLEREERRLGRERRAIAERRPVVRTTNTSRRVILRLHPAHRTDLEPRALCNPVDLDLETLASR